MTDDRKVILTSRVAEGPAGDTAEKGRCSKCREEVWLAQRTLDFLATRDAIGVDIVCNFCFIGDAATMPEEEEIILGPVPKARR